MVGMKELQRVVIFLIEFRPGRITSRAIFYKVIEGHINHIQSINSATDTRAFEYEVPELLLETPIKIV